MDNNIILQDVINSILNEVQVSVGLRLMWLNVRLISAVI